MTNPTLRRGALPAPRSVLAAAKPHEPFVGAPPTFLMRPQRTSMWGNDVHGDCVTAEEAFAKACHAPEIFIGDAEVISWASKHGVLEGAYLPDVMTWMRTDGFNDAADVWDDGPHFSVDWTNAATLKSAIAVGPVKLGVAADQIEAAYWATNGRTGWVATGFHNDANEDHCVALCGYGSLSWLAQQLGTALPAGVNGSSDGYALFTWNSVGIIDAASMIAVTHEAWLRNPTTVHKVNTGWSAWSGLGGGLTSDPAVTMNAQGRLEVFARGIDNALYHIWQTAAGGDWSKWARLGGGITGDIAVAKNVHGRLEVFARGTDNALHHIWQTPGGGGWSAWSGLGGGLTSDPAVATHADGGLEVFARGTDNALYHIWQTAAGGDWSKWARLGGGLTSKPAVATHGDGRLEVLARGNDNALYHIWQTTPHGDWSTWARLGGGLTSNPAVAGNPQGRLEAFARGNDNALYHIWQM